ncbi:MAG: MFS transporter [Sphingobacteriaceae bacterium]
MAFITGLIVANIYYCQPLVLMIAKEFGKAENVAARITYYTQGGYALGLLFLVPLGDRLERKKQILMTTALAVFSLLMAAMAPSFLVLSLASVLIGFASVVPQLILPLAANLARAEERGKVIGTIMSGLLIGILLSRTLSGAIGAVLGWRAMFYIAAGICVLVLFIIQKRFPKNAPRFNGTYGALMRSLWYLIKTQPELREASLINALAFGVFSAFWTTMVLFLGGSPFNYQSDIIGLFGLAGAAGALAAPLVGRISDKNNPRIAIGYCLCIIFIAVLLLYFGEYNITAFIISIILLDLGQQGVHISNQTRVYALDPEARNRLNTVLMTASFIGVTLGSAFGIMLWQWNNWHGVCLGMGLMTIASFGTYLITYKKQKSPKQPL